MRTKYIFLILILLLLGLGIFIFSTLNLSTEHLLLIEGVIGIALVFMIILYYQIIRPIHLITTGMDLLSGQDFNSRLKLVGQVDADKIVNVFNRIMSQLKHERLRLREQNIFLDLLIQASPMGVVIMTLDGEIDHINPMALKMMELNTHPDKSIKHLIELDSPLAAELGEIPNNETKVIRLNDANIYKCSHSYFIDHGFKHPFYLIERMTDEVIHAEKRAYEKVIRMIAHEVNNSTAGITSTLDTISQALTEEKGMEDICDMIRICIERCFSMSHFITRFADVVKIPEPTFQKASINDIATLCKRFMEGMCNERNIELNIELDAEVSKVQLDASLFEQVLVNIIKNAAESIQQNGNIWIRTIAPATIEVIDNGPGITKDTETKLFTPFFSTKSNGQGIGLVFIREALTLHDCKFSLKTGTDGLTRFRISFKN